MVQQLNNSLRCYPNKGPARLSSPPSLCTDSRVFLLSHHFLLCPSVQLPALGPLGQCQVLATCGGLWPFSPQSSPCSSQGSCPLSSLH